MSIPVSSEEFETLVVEAIESLPQQILDRLDNVAITIADWPSSYQLSRSRVGRGYTLFGLYEGVPQTARTSYYGMVVPDKITIFRGPICTYFRTPEQIRKQVRQTVVHEIAHHFGMDEEQIAALGY